MVKGEVITLQLGSFSNFVASHLWNLQSQCFYYSKDAPFGHEFDHDVYYREGRSFLNKTTFTPRTVLIDLKGSVRNCSWPVDQAYDGPNDDEQKVWDGQVQIHKAEPQAASSKSEELGEVDVRPKKAPLQKNSWAGYLQNKYHPKSVTINNDFDSDNPQQPFGVFNQGETLWRLESENFEDRVRWFAEDCDHLSAFNIMMDTSNGFSGFASSCLDYLDDQFRAKSRVVWSLSDVPANDSAANYRALNTVLAYQKMQELADVVLPLSVSADGLRRHLRSSSLVALDPSPFTGGAALAMHVDSILSSLKLKSEGGCDFVNFLRLMTIPDRKFVVSSMAASPLSKDGRLEDLSPKCDSSKMATSAYAVSRGTETSHAIIVRISNTSAASTFHTMVRHPTKFCQDYFPEISSQSMRSVKGSQLVDGLFVVKNSADVVAHFDDLRRRRVNLGKMHRISLPEGDVTEAIQNVASLRENYLK
ncbi:protein misato homolog 1 [Galendromus occidentalis]|uniref:Protein misato homolog 1 n=1 Tax=Galendromus occidentalis TaxID=34638 RepID=A0AAJ6QTH6_9ACAR|nr:protein misato homolog 1 [Galendromus occidentalis]